MRIATGTKCCMLPGSEDIGGTKTASKDTIRAVVDLKPGNYVYYGSATGTGCAAQRGSLVVE